MGGVKYNSAASPVEEDLRVKIQAPSDALRRAVQREPGPPTRLAERLLLVAVSLLLFARLAALLAGGGPLPPRRDLLHRVDLNHAPWYELVNLPGIGETRAREIVRDRERNGPFTGVDDLARVPGIGPVTVSRIRDLAFEGG